MVDCCRQDCHSGSQITGLLPLLPPPSILQNQVYFVTFASVRSHTQIVNPTIDFLVISCKKKKSGRSFKTARILGAPKRESMLSSQDHLCPLVTS